MSLNVIALGGNAILDKDPSDEGQKAVVAQAARYIADFVEKGEKVIVCHGNGPQVGNLLLQQKAGESEKNPQLKLDSCVAMTQGSIGYWLQNALINEFATRQAHPSVISLVTQVRVDPADPSFEKPSKP
ncbi:carbamate kinase, partial [Listeria monocytogenes]|nr:carbamate kinase [Listeria monocytogenes]